MAVREGTKSLSKGVDLPKNNLELMDPPPELFTQRKRPERGRYLLQVDRQTKSSYAKSEDAEAAGMVIKTGHPIVQVAVYDAIDCVNKMLELPEK
jgi:hypothetical protein